MDKLMLGIICGLVFGIIDVAIMVPMKFDTGRKKVEALTGAFIERFALGLVIPTTDISLNPIAAGAVFGLLLSVPTALITRAYAPIIGMGLVGGIIIGVITNAVT